MSSPLTDSNPDVTTPSATEQALSPTAWVERHGDVLWRYARARLHDPHEAEDAIQEALASAWAGREEFRKDSSERTWLLGILRHKIGDMVRGSKSPPVSLGADELFNERGLWRENPAAWSRPDESFFAAFEKCLALIPASLADVFVLREVRGMACGRISEELGISIENVWVRLHRAREGLRKCLGRKWADKAGKARRGGS